MSNNNIWKQTDLTYWKHKTKTGRVLYNRKPRPWNPKGLVRIVDLLDDRKEELHDYAIQLRYVHQIFNLSLYPEIATQFISDETFKQYVENRGLWSEIQSLWKQITKFIAETALEKAGVPEVVRVPLMKFLFAPLYDMIYGLFGPK